MCTFCKTHLHAKKIGLTLSRAYTKLNCKEESFRFPSTDRQIDRHTSCYFYIRIKPTVGRRLNIGLDSRTNFTVAILNINKC